jgi:toxin ParE1/3/4
MVRIVLSKVARLDLKEIVDYIKRDSIRYALLEKGYIQQSIEQLALQTEKGKIFTDEPNYRELVFRNYRIVYQIENLSTIYHYYPPPRPFYFKQSCFY